MITIADIKSAVASHFDLPPVAMVSQRRNRREARPRQIAMALARDFTPHSYPVIGREFGGRDHTTVMHALRVVDDLRQRDPSFAAHLDAIRASLLSRVEA